MVDVAEDIVGALRGGPLTHPDEHPIQREGTLP
jgi:hypothetical protein